MTTVFGTLDHVLLMAPGPSPVASNVLQAMSLPTLGHLDPDCIKVMDAIQGQLRAVCKTGNDVTFPISGTGSAGMETCFVNLIEPGDAVLVVNNGVFSSRMVEVASRLGANVDVVESPWGTPVKVQKALEATLAHFDIDHVSGHFHDTYGQALSNTLAALEVGVWNF